MDKNIYIIFFEYAIIGATMPGIIIVGLCYSLEFYS
jgi:hypothetical protein